MGLAVKFTRENTNVYLGPTLIAAAEPIPIKNVVQSNSVGADYIVFGSNRSNSPNGAALHGVNGIQNVGSTTQEESLILGQNLKKIYHL